jgi:protein-disulfide isomerase
MRAIAALFLTLGLMASLAACKPSGGGGASTSTTTSTSSATGAVTQDDMSLGDPNAKVAVVEYASLGCPVCAHWNNTVFQDFKTKYIDTGKVRYTLREFLTGDAPVASAGFLLARCAGAPKYFQVVDAVWRQEEPLLESDRNAEKRDALVKIAQSMGLTESQFNTCVTDDKAILALNSRSEKWASEDHIENTPTFVINGKIYDNGFLSLADMDKAVATAQAAPK